MAKSEKRIALLIFLICLSTVIGAYWSASNRSPAEQARANAERWLTMYRASPEKALRGKENADLFMRCFEVGVSPNNFEFEDLLATCKVPWRHDGIVEYYWSFTLEPPPGSDATTYIVTVQVKGNPPVIDTVWGSHTVD